MRAGPTRTLQIWSANVDVLIPAMMNAVHNFASIGMSDIATYPFWYTVAWADLLRSLGFGLQPRFNPKAQVPMVISRGFGGSVLHIQLQMLWYYGARNTWQRRIEGRQRPTDAFTRLMAERRAAEQAGARPPPLPTFAETQEVRGSPAPARCARGAVNARLNPGLCARQRYLQKPPVRRDESSIRASLALAATVRLGFLSHSARFGLACPQPGRAARGDRTTHGAAAAAERRRSRPALGRA